MNSIQYEELCRFFIADKYGMPIEKVESVRKGPDSSSYKHQIDLCWEDGNELTRYENIADAKWRSLDKVDQDDVVKLQQVKVDIHANKAMMITNTDFTKGAKKVCGKQENRSSHCAS